MKKLAITFALASCSVAVPSSAEVISQHFDMVASGFFLNNPITVSGRFELSFDNTTDIEQSEFGISVQGEAFSKFVVKYGYRAATDTLAIGNDVYKNGCFTGGERFCFFVHNASSTLADYFPSGNYLSLRGAIGERTITKLDAPAVPEPSTWMTMIIGFGVVGYAMRRKTVLRYV